MTYTQHNAHAYLKKHAKVRLFFKKNVEKLTIFIEIAIFSLQKTNLCVFLYNQKRRRMIYT